MPLDPSFDAYPNVDESTNTNTPADNSGWTPGSDTTSVPTYDPQPAGVSIGDVFGGLNTALKTGLSAVGSAASGYASIFQTKNAISFARQQQQIDAENAQANLDIKRAQVTSSGQLGLAQISAQSSIDKARLEAETAIANAQMSRMPGLTTLFGGTSAPTSNDWVMLLLTGLGVWFAYRSLHHG